ncbi:MAG: hypothetical protein VYA51_08365, partial [Planctomycetota bacterium]|nr:hypothetical protein [Planctomycetota bacterium]
MRWSARSSVAAAALSWVAAALPAQSDGPALRVGHAQTEPEARAELAALAATYQDREAWERRRALLRRELLAGAGLTKLPP